MGMCDEPSGSFSFADMVLRSSRLATLPLRHLNMLRGITLTSTKNLPTSRQNDSPFEEPYNTNGT